MIISTFLAAEPTVTIIVALITAIIGPIIITWFREILTKKRDLIKESIDNNNLIDQQLHNIMEIIECDRIWIAQFHNGGHFYPTGKSIQKFSIFYEKTSPQTQSITDIFQNIPVSLFPKLLSKVYKDGYFEAITKQVVEENNIQSLSDIPGESLHFYAIDDLNDRFVGLLCISFNKTNRRLNNEESIFVRQKVGAVGTILDTFLKK